MATVGGEPEFPIVVDSAGEVDFEYQLLTLTLNSGVRIHTIAVGFIEEKLLVALPLTTWHKRTASKRALPQGGLIKPVTVELGVAELLNRESLLEGQEIKVWMGFLAADLVKQLALEDEVEASGKPFDHSFWESGSDECFPFAGGLVAAAQEHFAFETAGETVGDEEQQQIGAASGSLELESRMGRLELLVGKLSSQLETVLESGRLEKPTPKVDKTSAAPAATPKRPSALRNPKHVDSGLSVTFPSLDQSVVSAALAAGVDQASLQEMQKMMEDTTVKSRRMAEPKAPRSKAAAASKPSQSGLSETDSEEVEVVPISEGSGGATPSGAQPMELALSQLTEIVQVLTADRLKKQRTSRVEAALEGVSASGLSESGTIGSGKKTAAARRALRNALQESPDDIVNLIEKLMMEDLGSQTVTPGQPLPNLCAKAWVEHRSRIGHWKSSAYTAWTVAAALDALRAGNVAGCRARLNLMLLMLDQTACDRGSWTIAAELSLEPGPPMAVLAQHQAPSIQDGEMPFSRLLDARWAEVAMAHVKDTEEYVVRRSKLGKKDPQDADLPTPKVKPKAKNKQGAGGQHQTEAS